MVIVTGDNLHMYAIVQWFKYKFWALIIIN